MWVPAPARSDSAYGNLYKAAESFAGVQQGDLIEAKLTSVDPSTCKVWLSMRQVHPDPLQETLDSLLAEDLAALDDSDSTTHASAAGTGVMVSMCGLLSGLPLWKWAVAS